MPNNTFLVPQSVEVNKEGYEFLAHLAAETVGILNEEVVIDFEYCSSFEGNLCSVLGSILDSMILRGNSIEIRNLSGTVRGALGRNGFLGTYLENINISDLYHTNIPYRKFQLEDEGTANEFFKKELFEKKDMPKMSALAQKEIIRNIFEVCLNAVTHGECKFVYCCGQLYSRKDPAKAIMTFSDLGKTIKANVNEFLSQTLSANDAIIWALTAGKTTKTGPTPGGLGLKLLQDLISLNKGTLQFVSGNGFVQIKDDQQTLTELNIDYPGTIVTIELLLNDPNFYYLKSEENNLNNIF